ncbi:MAG: hypothetical protein AB1508_16730 [Pseudomonadota bacterium]
MTKVKIYKYRRPYVVATDHDGIARRMGTRKYIEMVGGTVIEESEIEVESSALDADEKTTLDFVPPERSD